MSYVITEYTKRKAKRLGVKVRPSRKAGKKIDVIKNGKVIASVGAIGFNDYPTYMALEKKGSIKRGVADKRRRAYKKRHVFRARKDTPAYWADQLLW